MCAHTSKTRQLNLLDQLDGSSCVQRALPLNADLLINVDLPASKELHFRRGAAVLGPTDRRVCATVHFVVAGQTAQFRALEKFTNAAIQEMPVHAADILLQQGDVISNKRL